MSEELKREAAARALALVEPGMKLGLGTGSTAWHFVDLLGQKVAEGFSCICVPTSEVTAEQARGLSIPLTTLDETPHLDLTVDGADEIDPQLALIKGGGGALLREKIVAHASDRMVVIADQSKLVDRLGAFSLPIEVNSFGLGATRRAILDVMAANADLGEKGTLSVRQRSDGQPFISDGGHLIVDASFGLISNPQTLSDALLGVPGVVQHGLFINMSDTAFVAETNGVRELHI